MNSILQITNLLKNYLNITLIKLFQMRPKDKLKILLQHSHFRIQMLTNNCLHHDETKFLVGMKVRHLSVLISALRNSFIKKKEMKMKMMMKVSVGVESKGIFQVEGDWEFWRKMGFWFKNTKIQVVKLSRRNGRQYRTETLPNLLPGNKQLEE